MTFIDNMMRDQEYYGAPKDYHEYCKWHSEKYGFTKNHSSSYNNRKIDYSNMETPYLHPPKQERTGLFYDDEL